jgi:ATP/ADP translocase
VPGFILIIGIVMTKQKTKAGKKKQKKVISPFKNYWNKENYVIFLIGIAILIVGNFLLSISPWDNPVSLTIAPLILLIGYIVIFPLSIFYKKKNSLKQSDDSSKS